mmetsp:Transcript_39805/g.61009  ORF Transcript_39805/g.61009 Transcript_39805/m.61009 type:complete len:90 (+) Transcript_39805:858-1127(+)
MEQPHLRDSLPHSPKSSPKRKVSIDRSLHFTQTEPFTRMEKSVKRLKKSSPCKRCSNTEAVDCHFEDMKDPPVQATKFSPYIAQTPKRK